MNIDNLHPVPPEVRDKIIDPSTIDPTEVSIPSVIPAQDYIAQLQASESANKDPLEGTGFVRPNQTNTDSSTVMHTRNNQGRHVEYGDNFQPAPTLTPAEKPASFNTVNAAGLVFEPVEAAPLAAHRVPQEQVQPTATPVQSQTLSAVQSEQSLADTNASYHSLDKSLPSQFSVYNFNRMSIRPLSVKEHIKISSSSRIGSVRGIVQAVGNCIDRDVFQLAFQDFMYLAMWLRVNSYTDNKLTLTWSCDNKEHVKRVYSKELAEQSLRNVTEINVGQMEIKTLDVEKLEGLTDKLAELGVYITAPTVADFLDTLELTSEDVDEENAFFADTAPVLNTVHGKTLKDRIGFLKSLVEHPKAMEIYSLLSKVAEITDDFGVANSVTVKCSTCGHVTEQEVEVELLTFFPFGT